MTDAAARRRPSQVPVLTLSPRVLLASLISFEALIVLYMFAGLFKGDPRFAWIPADPTGLFFALSVAVGGLILALSPITKRSLYPVFACLLLVLWLALSLAWSPSRVYGPDKVFFMATLAFWGLSAGALIIAPDPTRVRRLLVLLVLASLAVAIEAISLYLSSSTASQLYVGSGNYLALGRLCGLGAQIVFVAWLFSQRRFGAQGLVCLGLFGLFVVVLTIGGGRGPLLATAAGLVIPLLAGIGSSRYGLRLARYQAAALGLVVLALGGLAVWAQTSEQTPETLRRLERIFSDDMDNSAETRAGFYRLAPKLWAEAPMLGHGAGSWPLLTGQGDLQRYPHNLFAEVAVEGGMVGLILLGAMLAIALRPVSLARLRSDPLAMCVLMLFVNAFLNAMLTADLPGNRVMFLMLGVLTLLALPQGESRPRIAAFLRRPPPVESFRTVPDRRA